MKTIALAAVMAGWLGIAPAAADDLELAFEVESTRSAILVRGVVDGKPALFILDTGASRTILARELVRLSSEPSASPRFSSEGPGLVAAGRYTEATIDLGGRRWRNRSVVAMSMAEVSRAYARTIDGLLGQDFLREFDRVTIDFRTKRILLSSTGPIPGSMRLNPGRDSS
jgi:predicted aspartyl protease